MKKSFILCIVLALFFSLTGLGQDKDVSFIITTKYGKIQGRLYNDTPQHRDNFIKLIREGWYDGSRFHRIIRDLSIQGGANKDGRLDPGYLIPAEIVSGRYNKRGALGAARIVDEANPERKSSGSQFYIVTGRKFPGKELDALESRFGTSFTQEQRQVYINLGGFPYLDGTYTVFGEIIKGMNVVDKIAEVPLEGTQPVDPLIINIDIIE